MTDLLALRNKVAVIGVGTTRYGSFPHTDEYGLAADAFRTALAMAGSTRSRSTGWWSAASPITRAWARCSASIRAGR